MKQGEEKVKLAKEEDNNTNNYIFQKNRKTIIGAFVVISFLVIVSVASAVSGFKL